MIKWRYLKVNQEGKFEPLPEKGERILFQENDGDYYTGNPWELGFLTDQEAHYYNTDQVLRWTYTEELK